MAATIAVTVAAGSDHNGDCSPAIADPPPHSYAYNCPLTTNRWLVVDLSGTM